MRTFNNNDLRQLLTDDDASGRMLALEMLSEGYAQSEAIIPDMFAAWDRWGAAQAFPDFPMLSYLPIAPQHVAECCRRARAMAAEGKLTAPATRSAGKLLEQVVNLKADELRPHLAAITQAANVSKIFFRVDVEALSRRLELYGLDADGLAQRLESAIETLTRQANNTHAFQDGLHALEALRFQHPDYLDMNAAVKHAPSAEGPAGISFQLSLQSLIQFEQVGAEATLAVHLTDDREAIHVSAVEALVRIGTPLAAAHMIAQFSAAETSAQRWIARGLQRIRAAGLAQELAQLRSAIDDPALWLMLLVAEVRQFDMESLPRITTDVQRIGSYAGALIDALNVYVRMHAEADGSRMLQQNFMSYLQDANQHIQSKITAEQ